MKPLFLSLILTIGATSLFGQDNGFIEDMKKKWKNAMDYTIELAELMPEEHYDFKPTEDQMSFHDQMLHIVGNMSWLSSSYLGGERTKKKLRDTTYTKAEVIEILKEGFTLSLAAIDGVNPDQLNNTVEFFAGPMHIRQIINLMNDHVTHHRGQAIVYANLKGIKPPRYRGW